MRGNQFLDEYKACKRKYRYKNEHEALQGIKKARVDRGAELDYYACPFCKGFHLTKYIDLGEECFKERPRPTVSTQKGKGRKVTIQEFEALLNRG